MIYMGIDPGYRESTTVVLFDSKDTGSFKFMTIHEGTEFDDLIHKLYEIAVKHKIAADHVKSPHNPAVEHELRKRLPTLKQMLEATKVEKL